MINSLCLNFHDELAALFYQDQNKSLKSSFHQFPALMNVRGGVLISSALEWLTKHTLLMLIGMLCCTEWATRLSPWCN